MAATHLPEDSNLERDRPAGRGCVFLPLGIAVLLLGVAGGGCVVKLLSTPEMDFFATRTWVVGTAALTIRCMAMGVAAMGMAGLWFLLRLRFAPVFAGAGCLAVMATPALDYSYDARTVLGSTQGLAWLGVALLLGCGLSEVLRRYGSRRAAGWVVTALFVAVAGRQALCGRALLHQRHAFFQFRDSVERAAAPGETVVVSDAWAAGPLYWYGTPGLRQGIVMAFGSGNPAIRVGSTRGRALDSLVAQHEEKVVVGARGDWLYEGLRAQGYVLTEDRAPVPWERLGGVRAPLAATGTRIFLATPAPRP